MDNPLVMPHSKRHKHAIKANGKKTKAKKPLQLGRPSPIPASPDKAVLDRVPNPHADTDYVARFTAPEFTSVVPDHRPARFRASGDRLCAGALSWSSRSRSSFTLNSFRNHGAFHEDCTVAIGKKLFALLKPKWLRIGGYWYPRGGMPIDVFWQAGKLPKDVWVPDQGVAPYRGRG